MSFLKSIIQKFMLSIANASGLSARLEEHDRALARILASLESVTQSNLENAQTLNDIVTATGNIGANTIRNLEAGTQLERGINYVDRGTQYLLAAHYREQAGLGKLLSFRDVEFRNHSQSGEDGLLCYIFALIGSVQNRSVEICAGNGRQCNSANLIINHGWHSLLFEGNEALAQQGDTFFRQHPDTWIIPPRFVNAWITAENVNELIQSNGVSGEIDLLSIDVDGIDYWLWNAIEVISPRVVVVEVNPVLGAEASVTVPYKADFLFKDVYEGDTLVARYCGASLLAFVNLARKKGYRLIGSNSLGFNAFFMRNDLGRDYFPEVDVQSCVDVPGQDYARAVADSAIRKYEWETV